MKDSIKSRNYDFITTCNRTHRQLAEQGQFFPPGEIVRRALLAPAPRYYIDIDYARLIAATVERRVPMPQLTREDRRKWADFAADYARLRISKPHLPSLTIIDMLCRGEAGSPKFYISRRTALYILRRAHRPTS